MAMGENPMSEELLALIGLDTETVPRFRDCWVSPDYTKLTVLTRTGGGNRDEYKSENQNLRDNEYFVEDYDDDFDNTFAKFVYELPESGTQHIQIFLSSVAELYPDTHERLVAEMTRTNTEKMKMFTERTKAAH